MTKYILSLFREEKSLLVDELALVERHPKTAGRCFFSFLYFFFVSCVLPKKGVIIPGRAFHKLLGNFSATSGIWNNFFRFQQLFAF